MSINYTALATGALGLTVALAWNDAVRKTIETAFPPQDGGAAVMATFAYALAATVLVIGVVAAINHTRQLMWEFGARPSKGGAGSASGGGDAGPPIVSFWTPPGTSARGR